VKKPTIAEKKEPVQISEEQKKKDEFKAKLAML